MWLPPSPDTTALESVTATNFDALGNATIEVPAAVKGDVFDGLADGSLGENLFNGITRDPSDGPITALEILIPVSAAQIAEAETNGYAIRQTNPALKYGSYAVHYPDGVKDKHYTAKDPTAPTDPTDPTDGFHHLWILVTEESIAEGVTIEVDYGATTDFAGGADADLTITVDLSKVVLK